MALIRKRLKVEMWIFDQLQELYETEVSSHVSILQQHSSFPIVRYAIQKEQKFAALCFQHMLLYSRVRREFKYLIPKMDNETIETDFYELVLYFW